MHKNMIILICIGVFAAYGVYIAYPIVRAIQIDKELVRKSIRYSLEDPVRAKHILILGDSTAVGVGAKPQESVAARLGEYMEANVENHAKSGAVTADLAGQIEKAQRDSYDLIEIQIGANDILGVNSLDASASSLDSALTALAAKSAHIVFLTAGDLGKAPMLRWPLTIIMSYRARVLRERFMQLAQKHNAIYVDIYSEPDIFSGDPARYHAPDGLHMSSDGYQYWFELVKKYLEK